jgi:hypothetical protein
LADNEQVYVLIKEMVAGQIVVATAGGGSAAKSSNELGRLAALAGQVCCRVSEGGGALFLGQVGIA